MIKRAGVLALILACTVYANDVNGNEIGEDQFFEDSGIVRLEETTISGDGFENTIRNTPKNITIITSKDIKESGAKNIVEAVQLVPGVKVSNGLSGTGVIDIRGQGAKSGINTAIIVDGVKMNHINMSSFNLNSIPIEIVEKIEVIPSGASVIYGDNTVGGAVNIITKNGSGKDSLTLQTEAGSYNELNSNFGFNTTAGKFKIFGNTGRKNTEGYRDNAFSKSDDVMVGTKYQINQANSLSLKYDYNKIYSGATGSLAKDEVDDDRTQTNTPNDWRKSETNRVTLGYNYKKNNLEVINNTTYYERDSVTSLRRRSENITTNISNDFKVKYNTGKNRFIAGFDLADVEIKNKLDSSWIKKQSVGVFLSDTYNFTEKLDLIGGIRQQHTKFDYSLYDNKTYNNIAYDIALNYKYSDTGSTFISYGTDFRTPRTTELLTRGVFNYDLKPQTGENFEVGVKDYIGETFISAAVFHKLIKDEIYTYTANGDHKVKNYDEDNKKIGFELLAERKFMKKLTLTGSYSYLQSEIDGGADKGNKTPGVPENKFSLGAKYDFTDRLKSNLMLNYTGKSYAYGDAENKSDKVDAYTTLDLNISYKINDSFDIYGGIKNLTDEEYYEYVKYDINRKKLKYYPAPERQYYIGFRYTM